MQSSVNIRSPSVEEAVNKYSHNISLVGKLKEIRSLLQKKVLKQGVHSSSAMQAAGFLYTNIGDTARCDSCGLEVSGWTADMVPFTVHKQRNPTCAFVCSIQSSIKIVPTHMSTAPQLASATVDEERPYKRQKTEITKTLVQSNELVEVESLKEIRKCTFSHWPQHASPSSAQMIDAGFFNCNVGDRVICIYCNLICQQWIPNTDDPCEVHKTLSPKCPYVIKSLECRQISLSNNNQKSQVDSKVHVGAQHDIYASSKSRFASFVTWQNEQLPNVDDLVNAGFFYTGTKTIVTCFYCNGSLQNWGANDNPMIEHARWFPNCAYAKQLCGPNLYKKIQDVRRRLERKTLCTSPNFEWRTTNDAENGESFQPHGDNVLSKMVDARLDLPISQRMLRKNYALSIVRRCWEDQLLYKGDDFVSEGDLFIACTILNKQIQYINGKKENIIIPSEYKKKLRESEQTVNGVPPSTLCNLCHADEKRLACMPCGHFYACVPCGQKLRSCMICHKDIDGFLRIYI
ncbi:hypothetical protein I4U23_002634 [Adineta vaga]|nr:hypothetical protein I4U23_002634 [Adineta vaga]